MSSMLLGIFTLVSILALVTHLLVLERADDPTKPEKAWLAAVSILRPIAALAVGLTSGTSAMFLALLPHSTGPIRGGKIHERLN
ncbi:hypothetical protein [Saccharopolyspora gloriosae]|uniref:hypothetical protein n=1 Tax=Saccharopolyspora gloriosae TaxID=455344 RepID=UPI001FB735DF|nr:hypothetical protein [Saccharopolyspora gloriosae]